MSKDNDEIVFQLENLNSTLNEILNELQWWKDNSFASKILSAVEKIESIEHNLDITYGLSTASQILQKLDDIESNL